MGDRNRGVLLASVQMALAHQVPRQGPTTAREIAAYLTLLNPDRPFSGSQVLAVLRSRPDLFAVAERRILGFGPPRWRLEGHPARGPDSGPAEQPPADAARTEVGTAKAGSDIDLIEDVALPASADTVSSRERQALERERARRRAERGRTIVVGNGRTRYRHVIDPTHPISRLDDQTLDRFGSEPISYIDSD